MYGKTNIIIIVVFSILISFCKNDINKKKQIKRDTIADTGQKTDTANIDTIVTDTTDLEKILIKEGLVCISDIDSTILVDLKYSTIDNFLKIDMYGDFDKAYFRKETAEKLKKAQTLLKKQKPSYSLIVFDATRPRTIQKLMWDSIKVPKSQKHKYLANPKYISMHSYGLAVDLSIVDSTGNEIDMGTKYDSFEELAYPVLEQIMLKKGLLSEKQVQNRLLLRDVMTKAGFNTITTEWWHFSIYSKQEAKKLFSAIETHILSEQATEYIAELNKEDSVTNINISFKIQLKTSMQPIDTASPIFKNLPIYRYYHEGMYKYTTGNFKNLQEAYEHRDKIKNMGFDDCFVAGFNNNQRIGIRDAIELLQ